MRERQTCGDGCHENEAAFAAIANAGTGDAESGVAPSTGALANPESPTTDRVADARATQVYPEWSEIDRFAVEKAHGEVRVMPLVQPALTAGVGQILVQAENFRKKFRIPPNQQLRVPFKHAAPIPSSHFELYDDLKSSASKNAPSGVSQPRSPSKDSASASRMSSSFGSGGA